MRIRGGTEFYVLFHRGIRLCLGCFHQFYLHGVGKRERSLPVLQLSADKAGAHAVVQCRLFILEDLLLVVETETRSFEQILIQTGDPALEVIVERTVFFPFPLYGSAFLWVGDGSNDFHLSLLFSLGLFYAFLVFADAGEFYLVVLVEGKSFALGPAFGGREEIAGVMGGLASDGGLDHLNSRQQFYSRNQSTWTALIKVMINQELYLEVKGKWKSLYPVYFDASKTLQEGRRLPVEQCVKNPTLEEVTRAVCACQLRNIIEPHKGYSRDYFLMGRLKVEMLSQNGKPIHASISNKKSLLVSVGKFIRELRAKKA